VLNREKITAKSNKIHFNGYKKRFTVITKKPTVIAKNSVVYPCNLSVIDNKSVMIDKKFAGYADNLAVIDNVLCVYKKNKMGNLNFAYKIMPICISETQMKNSSIKKILKERTEKC
jgi:hypothetical protein